MDVRPKSQEGSKSKSNSLLVITLYHVLEVSTLTLLIFHIMQGRYYSEHSILSRGADNDRHVSHLCVY